MQLNNVIPLGCILCDLSFFKHVGILASIQMGWKEKASFWRDALAISSTKIR